MRLPAIAVKAAIDAATRKIKEIDMWGYAGRSIEGQTVLYELPLPNLSGSRLCLGGTEMSTADGDIRAAVERAIFDTPFNHHSGLVGAKSISFLDYVARHRGRCPLSTLKPISHGHRILGGVQ